MRSVSIRKQNTTISNVSNQFIFYFCIISTVFQLFYGKNSSKKNHRAIKISTQCKENKICQNRTLCSNLTISNTSVPPKNLKIQGDQGNLYINLLQNELAFYHALVIFKNCFRERISFYFQKILKALLGTNTN